MAVVGHGGSTLYLYSAPCNSKTADKPYPCYNYVNYVRHAHSLGACMDVRYGGTFSVIFCLSITLTTEVNPWQFLQEGKCTALRQLTTIQTGCRSCVATPSDQTRRPAKKNGGTKGLSNSMSLTHCCILISGVLRKSQHSKWALHAALFAGNSLWGVQAKYLQCWECLPWWQWTIHKFCNKTCYFCSEKWYLSFLPLVYHHSCAQEN